MVAPPWRPMGKAMLGLLATQDMATLHVGPAIAQIVVATGLFAVLVRVIMKLVPPDDGSVDGPPADRAEPKP
jgi:predicted lipid-binding transport protein (Tim44 family)